MIPAIKVPVFDKFIWITLNITVFLYIMRYTTVLTIAGSDCSGGAGIQADIKTISALGCYAASVITAITVQNTCGVKSIYPIPAEVVGAQIQALTEDLQIDAVKIGMVTDETIIATIADMLANLHIPIIFDPVLVSSSGHPLTSSDALKTIQESLIPRCTLITPNIPEAEVLSGMTILNPEDMVAAGRNILQNGCQNVLVKGGHLMGKDMTDILVTGHASQNTYHFHSPKIMSNNTHGTGCTLSSAIASFVAQGLSLVEAVQAGKTYLTHALEAGKDITSGRGNGPLNHFFNPIKPVIK